MPEPEKKSRSWIFIAVLAALVYFLVAAKPLGKELTFSPKWVADLGSQPASASDGPARPFSLSGRYGYFLPDGRLLSSARAADRVAISSGLFAEYGAEADQIGFHRVDGKDAFTLKDPGLPAFVSDRLFLFSKDGIGVSSYSGSGARQWSRDASSVITCFDANASDAVLGGLDGRLAVVAPDGSLAFDYSPGGSRLQVILGCAISADSARIAVVCGVDRQRFILLERRSGGYRVSYHAYLKSDFRRRVFVHFSDDGRYVLYEKDGGLCVLDSRTRRTSDIAVSGTVREVRQSASGDCFLILSEDGSAQLAGRKACATLKAVRVPATPVMEESFSASGFFLDRSGETIFVGGDDRIVSLEMGMI